MIAGNTIWLSANCTSLGLWLPVKAVGAESGEEVLSEVCRDQVVQDRVDGGADIEEDVCHHVEVMIEIIEKSGRSSNSN